MSGEAVKAVLQRWLSDERYRTEMFWNADGTIHRTTLDLEWEEFVALKGIDWRAPAEELEPRIQALASGAEPLVVAQRAER